MRTTRRAPVRSRLAAAPVMALALAHALLASMLSAQPTSLTVRVRSQVDGRPLVNAEVYASPGAARVLTRENGIAVLRLPKVTAITVRVRQLGHAFQDLRFDAGNWPASADTIDVRLSPVALRLPTVTAREALACPQLPAASTPLAFDALDQLREGAERYETFRRTYRFRVEIERRTSRLYPGERRARENRDVERANGDRWGAPYRPGDVVERGRFGEFSAPILFVNALGDARFWEHHCLTTVQRDQDSALGPVVRLAFEPTDRVGWSDWRGVVTLDSATWVLRRLDFALDVRQRDGPRRLEGFTTFEEASPLVAVPDSTGAVWWYSEPMAGEAWGTPQVVQVLRRLSLEYRDAEPPVVLDTTPTLLQDGQPLARYAPTPDSRPTTPVASSSTSPTGSCPPLHASCARPRSD
jgi:hypothetical protein